jgi:hypothetical protein
MRLIPKILSVVLLAGCLVVTNAVVAGQKSSDHGCGPYGYALYVGRTPTHEETMTVLDNHEAWLKSEKEPSDIRRANLCKVNYKGLRMQRASWPREGSPNLRGANLKEANLQEAQLKGTSPIDEQSIWDWGLKKTTEAQFKINLQEANLWGANFRRASLQAVDLRGANLREANLQEATLQAVDLGGADLTLVDLAETIYEPKLGALPDVQSLMRRDRVDHRKEGYSIWRPELEKMAFAVSPAGLIELREVFKSAGMRTEERQLTYAIERSKRRQAWNPLWYNPKAEDPRPWLKQLAGKSESLFSYVLFELPSGYGMVPSRALATLGLLILVFSLVYMVALVKARRRAGIWVTWPTDRVYQEEGTKDATRVTTTFFFPRLQARAAGRWWGVLLRGVSIPLIALYFSLLSAFSLGWRELNVGTWIARVQSREYVLRATGWVRTVSGIQSLLSVYLLALWVLTYFGRPFE